MIFINPYLTEGARAQATYDAAMTQALGRALRFGQQKHVHVYHFLTAETIDVDLYEKREMGVIKVGGQFTRTDPYEGFRHSGANLVKTAQKERGVHSSKASYILDADTALRTEE